MLAVGFCASACKKAPLATANEDAAASPAAAASKPSDGAKRSASPATLAGVVLPMETRTMLRSGFLVEMDLPTAAPALGTYIEDREWDEAPLRHNLSITLWPEAPPGAADEVEVAAREAQRVVGKGESKVTVLEKHKDAHGTAVLVAIGAPVGPEERAVTYRHGGKGFTCKAQWFGTATSDSRALTTRICASLKILGPASSGKQH